MDLHLNSFEVEVVSRLLMRMEEVLDPAPVLPEYIADVLATRSKNTAKHEAAQRYVAWFTARLDDWEPAGIFEAEYNALHAEAILPITAENAERISWLPQLVGSDPRESVSAEREIPVVVDVAARIAGQIMQKQ